MDEPQILLPYKRLMELLDAAAKVEFMEAQIRSLEQRFGALRGEFYYLMETLRNK